GTSITGNTINQFVDGIVSANSGSDGIGAASAATSDLISTNTVSNNLANSGIAVFAPYLDVKVDNNLVVGTLAGLTAEGGFGGTAIFTRNIVSGSFRAGSVGLEVTTSLGGFGDADVTASATENLI